MISAENTSATQETRDRRAPVKRYNVVLIAVDILFSPSSGTGEFAFSTDVNGRQTSNTVCPTPKATARMINRGYSCLCPNQREQGIVPMPD
jgi:hypothetical protein